MTQSQPISLVGPVAQLPDNTFYTFRTMVDVPAAIRLNSIRLNGRFIVDNHIQAIRLNGHEVRVPGTGTRISTSLTYSPSRGDSSQERMFWRSTLKTGCRTIHEGKARCGCRWK